jgi:hypothetical protein
MRREELRSGRGEWLDQEGGAHSLCLPCNTPSETVDRTSACHPRTLHLAAQHQLQTVNSFSRSSVTSTAGGRSPKRSAVDFILPARALNPARHTRKCPARGRTIVCKSLHLQR